MSHYTDRTHFFRDDNDDRLAVITTNVCDRVFEAVAIEGLPDDWPTMCGVGDTRLSAIADLHTQIEAYKMEIEQ